MRLFIAALVSETNSFSPIPTGLAAFAESGIRRGDATAHPATYWTGPLHVWRGRAAQRDWTVTESLAAFAQPGGPVVQPVWEELHDAILADLEDDGEADVILLALHGAMMATGEDDCEGALLAAAWAIAPAAGIGALLDLHARLTARMLDAADLIVAFREYPLTDVEARAAALFDLAARTVAGAVRPVMREVEARMLVSMANCSSRCAAMSMQWQRGRLRKLCCRCR